MSEAPLPAQVAPKPEPSAIPPNRHASTEQRIGVLAGDRCCAGCGFNLFGQIILREPHYGLLMVRCPECGVPAAMQEYPTLTRVAGRLRALLAAAWIVAVLGGLAITGAIVYGFADMTSSSVLSPYTATANSAWSTWSRANQTTAQQAAWWGNYQAMETWWMQLPPSALFKEFGGWSKLNWLGLLKWVFAAAALVPIGVVWSVALPRLRGVRMAGVLMAPVVFAAALVADDMISTGSLWFTSLETLIRRQVGWPSAALTLAFGGVCLMVGAMVGRPIARALLRLVLPARLLATFSFLWIVDGLDMPRMLRNLGPRP